MSAAVLLAVALADYGLQSTFLPAFPGRDMARYLQAFVQLGYHVPMYPAVLATRGPLAALGVGAPLEAGGWFAELWLALLYAFSILAWAYVARLFGARAAVLTSALLLLNPGYAILFHELASDSLFAAAFAGWAVLLARAITRPSTWSFSGLGAGIGVLVLVRPDNEVLILMALLPLFLRAPWRERLSWVAASFVPAVLLSQLWTGFAEWRWGAAVPLKPSSLLLGIALVLIPFLLRPPWRLRVGVGLAVIVVAAVAVKGWPGQSPNVYVQTKYDALTNQFLYRAFELDRIMSPRNGPASRRVARIVKRQLLTQEPYRSYGVTVDRFFSSGSDRVFGDMTGVVPGNELAAATREAIRRHPGPFARSIASTFFDDVARRPVYANEIIAPPAKVSTTVSTQQPPPTQYVVVNGRRLPKPSEGQPIPGSRIGPALWTPNGQALEVWTSPTQHHTVFTDALDQRRATRFYGQVDRLASRIPTRSGNTSLIHRFNQASHVFPPIVVWLLVGLIALIIRRPRRALVALAPTAAALIVLVAVALFVPAIAEYAAPVSPAFLMLAAVGIVGVPIEPTERRRVSFAATERVVGLLVGVAALVWTIKTYAGAIKTYVDGAGAQHDLAVFLVGAGKVLHGASPYAYHGDRTFAYPPFLAFLIAPVHPLSSSAAALTWLLLSLAMIAAALWLLEVRDWRCYALVSVFPFTRSAVDLGTIEPLLLLAVAAAWRWRERIIEPAAAVGVTVVVKLFLWPLVVWLALMRRVRAAALAIGIAIALALISWAVIGFAGIGAYPSVLRRLADHESTSSYSVVALGVRAHLPVLVARVISVLVAVGLLVGAWSVARDQRRPVRERDVITLTLAIAAALAASPIVWVHYFLLLLVPLALTRPRLSWLWLVPFAYYPLGEATWPGGNARNLAIALVATLLLLFAGFDRKTRLR